MTSQGNVCRLCVEICQDYKSLYDESGNANEVQLLTSQYFDENLLHVVTGNNSNVMCMKCWHTISDFNSFQQSIYQAQRILHVKAEEIDIKSEEEFLPEDHIASGNCEKPTEWNIIAVEEFTLPKCDTETVHISSDDDISNTEDIVKYDYISNADDMVKYDDPVGVFVGKEFGNESNSSELLEETELIAECSGPSKIKDKMTKARRLSIALKASNDLIAQWMPILKCAFCTETCSTFSQLQRHFYVKHPLLRCRVKCCDRNYCKRSTFEDHIRLHINSNSFACKFCGKTLKCRRSLAYHIRKHHPVPIEATINPTNDSHTVSPSLANVSEISKKSIRENRVDRKSRRAKYIKRSDDFIAQIKPILNCYLCPEKYTKFSLFRQHFSDSHRDEKYYIKCCQFKLTSRCYLLEHLLIHANPDEYKCKICQLRYKTPVQLKLHMRKRHIT